MEECDSFPGKEEQDWGYEEGKDLSNESALVYLRVKHESQLSTHTLL